MFTKKKLTLASLLIRFVTLIFGVLMMGVVLQSYQLSSKIIQQEVDRTAAQASNLLQHLFDYKLMTMQSHQDSNAMSVTLQKLLKTPKSRELDFFFLDVEQSDPVNSPDFRFVTQSNGEMIWNDGNGYFYGLTDELLAQFALSVNFNVNWAFKNVSTIMGERNILLRRSPIINAQSGQVLGHLYVSLVLDNNFSVVDQMKVTSKSDGIILLSDGNVVASSILADNPLYQKVMYSLKHEDTQSYNSYILNVTDISIQGEVTPLSVVAIQNNSNILALEENYKYGLGLSLAVMLLLALITRQIIHRIVTGELSSLMEYARSASDNAKEERFKGSNIYEFEHVGRALEYTFSALKEKERSFQDLFNFSLSPIIVWSADGSLVQMNPAAQKALKSSLNSASIDESLITFQAKVAFYLQMVMKGETLMGVNIPIENKIYRWNLSPIEIESGIHSIIGQGLDITALIEAEKQSNLARIEAESSANARADFLAKMSHEIRTPLNAILGVSQLLKHSITRTKNKEQVDILHRSGEHLLTVLNDVLDFSKIEQGKLNIEFSEFAFSEFVQSLDNIHRHLCVEKALSFEMENNLSDSAIICTDQVRVNQVILNLLSNAVKFTSQGGVKVRFYLTNESKGHAELNIEVQDTGIGLSEESQRTMFEPFVQAERTTTREFGGSGLGLAIVKNLLDMLGGTIKVESVLAKGSSFYVVIPIGLANQLASSPKPIEPLVSYDLFLEKIRVLLVEDNKSNAFIAQAFCKKYQMDIDWVMDGEAAIKALQSGRYDLILMDNQMPNMDGVDATRIIRQDLNITTPIFACTADAFDSTKNAFMAAGANYVIVKPIKEKPLYNALLYFKKHYLSQVEQKEPSS